MPFLTSIAPTYSRAWVQRLVGTLNGSGVDNDLTSEGRVRLFTAVSGTLSPDTTIADFTQATFGGYATQQTDELVLANTPNGDGYCAVQNCMFVAAGLTVTENIMGYYVEFDTGDILVCYELFDTPIPIAINGDFVGLDLMLPLSFTNSVV